MKNNAKEVLIEQLLNMIRGIYEPTSGLIEGLRTKLGKLSNITLSDMILLIKISREA